MLGRVRGRRWFKLDRLCDLTYYVHCPHMKNSNPAENKSSAMKNDHFTPLLQVEAGQEKYGYSSISEKSESTTREMGNFPEGKSLGRFRDMY